MKGGHGNPLRMILLLGERSREAGSLPALVIVNTGRCPGWPEHRLLTGQQVVQMEQRPPVTLLLAAGVHPSHFTMVKTLYAQRASCMQAPELIRCCASQSVC